MTFAELKAELDKLTPEQLAAEVIWWGNERGGKICHVRVLEEEYVNFGYGCEPWSSYEQDLDCKKADADAVFPAGAVVLCSDCPDEGGSAE